MLNEDRATKAQLSLSKLAILKPLSVPRVRRIGGVDVAYIESLGLVVYAETDFPSIANLRLVKGIYPVKVSYVSTFLGFREGPPIINLMLNKVRELPDLLLVNGHGLAHPRRCGLATHLGIVLGLPTIGISRRLIGDRREIFNRAFSERVGRLYISPGNMTTLRQSVDIIRQLPLGHGYPEPLGKAHYESKKEIKECIR